MSFITGLGQAIIKAPGALVQTARTAASHIGRIFSAPELPSSKINPLIEVQRHPAPEGTEPAGYHGTSMGRMGSQIERGSFNNNKDKPFVYVTSKEHFAAEAALDAVLTEDRPNPLTGRVIYLYSERNPGQNEDDTHQSDSISSQDAHIIAINQLNPEWVLQRAKEKGVYDRVVRYSPELQEYLKIAHPHVGGRELVRFASEDEIPDHKGVSTREEAQQGRMKEDPIQLPIRNVRCADLREESDHDTTDESTDLAATHWHSESEPVNYDSSNPSTEVGTKSFHDNTKDEPAPAPTPSTQESVSSTSQSEPEEQRALEPGLFDATF